MSTVDQPPWGWHQHLLDIVHEDGVFIDVLERHLDRLVNAMDLLKAIGITSNDIREIQLRLECKMELNVEVGSQHTSLDRVHPEALYGSDSKPRFTNLLTDLPFILQLLNTSKSVPIHFGQRVYMSPRVNLRPSVVERILRNTIRNAVNAARRQHHTQVSVEVEVDIKEGPANRTLLVLQIHDDAGGLAAGIPRKINLTTWRSFLGCHPEHTHGGHGRAFLFIARYVESSGGNFTLIDRELSSGRGTTCRIELGLGPHIPR